jgi:hypothetical protein
MVNKQAFPKLLTWLLLNIIMPLLPIGAGIFVLLLQGRSNFNKLLDSTEFFLLSFTILAATVYDYFNSGCEGKIAPKVHWLVTGFLQILSRIILPVIVFATGMIFTAVYIDKNIAPIGLQSTTLIMTALRSAAGISMLCIALQGIILIADS